MVRAGAAVRAGGGRRDVTAPPVILSLVAVLCLLPSPASSSDLEINDAARSSGAALVEFKTALISSASAAAVDRVLASWNTSTSPCSGNWKGVLCLNGDVMGIQLDGLGLSGDIDVDALAALRFLRFLSFENNEFEGLMPDWKKLGALKSLFLSGNRFSGEIDDDAFSGMGSLKKVHLANNRFAGKIPTSLATTPRLLELRLENNGFTGKIPEFRAGLKVFNASNNRLDGPIPPSLSAMDPSAFSGNKGLCGKPVNSDCAIQSPPPPPLKSPPAGTNGDVESSISSAITGILMLTAICLLAVALIMALYLICRGDRGRHHYRLHRGGSFDPLYSPNNNPTAMPSTSPDRASTPSSSAGAGTSPSVGRLAFVRADRTQFSLQDLLRASAEVLGAGNLGSSYKAVLVDGQAVVVKRFKHMNEVGREEFQEHMRRLARLQHPNLLPLVAYYYRKEEKLLISDFVPNGNLATHLYGKDSSLDWSSRLKIIKGVAKGMSYLHRELTSLVLPHGHLKPSNVLLDHSFNPILMDYAMIPILNPGGAQNLLAAYKSPECTTKLGHPTRKTDVWTLGILILETLTATSPDSHLQTWIDSITSKASGNDESHCESVFDAKIQGRLRESGGQMRELLRIGMVCCREDLDCRWDLNEVVERIQNLKEMDDM